MKARFILLACLAVAIGSWGCNLFSPFHSEGSSDDPEVLLNDARGALRDGRPQDALNLLDRAKNKLGPNPPMNTQSAQIFYFHAVATARANDISFQSFIDMMQAASGLAKGNTSPGAVQDEIVLFDFNEQGLANLLRVFSIVQADLQPVVEALTNGTLTSSQFPYADDAYLSCGVASLVDGFILMLDDDHDPTNGFRLDSRLSIRKLDDTYQLLLSDPQKTVEQIRQETIAIVKISYPLLASGLECLWHYYNWSTFGKLKGDAPQPPAPLPATLQQTASGIFFQVVHLGLSALYQYAYYGG